MVSRSRTVTVPSVIVINREGKRCTDLVLATVTLTNRAALIIINHIIFTDHLHNFLCFQPYCLFFINGKTAALIGAMLGLNRITTLLRHQQYLRHKRLITPLELFDPYRRKVQSHGAHIFVGFRILIIQDLWNAPDVELNHNKPR